MRLLRFLAALGLVGLMAAGVYLLGDEGRAAGGDGTGHRLALESPSAIWTGVCPDYRDNAGAKFFWDIHAFTDALEAQLSHCGNIDTGPLGQWVVEERRDSRGGYSISAHVDARSHEVTFDWGEYVPSLSLFCWRGDNEENRPENQDEDRTAGMFLEVGLWHFGPPQRFYGEPTPVQYHFAGQLPSEVASWRGHPAQAEVALLPSSAADGPALETDSTVFAAGLRRAAAGNTDENSGPMLEFETWSGEARDSQGKIQFDLLGVERAAFPVLDACGA